MAKSNIKLYDIIEELNANFTIRGLKYDFSYFSIDRKATNLSKTSNTVKGIENASPFLPSGVPEKRRGIFGDPNELPKLQSKVSLLKKVLMPIRILMKFDSMKKKFIEEIKKS